MGVVWLGWHELLSRDVAVKFMLHATEADDPGFAMFLAGARAAGAVRHLGLTGILHADVIANVPYLVMEYVAGFSAGDVLDRFGLLNAETTIAIMRQVSDAVAELHDRAILHRDIKPSNILLDGDGRAYVTDFGLTCVRGQAGDVRVAGTPDFMAPEVLDGQFSPRSDVFALGVSMFELLTGGRAIAQLADSRLDPRIVELIERATKSDAIYRFKTARHFQRVLDDLGGNPADDQRVVSRLVARMRLPADSNHPDAISTETGNAGSTGSGNYFETIAALAKKHEHDRTIAADSIARPPVIPPPLPKIDPTLPVSEPVEPPPPPAESKSSWLRKLFGKR
jgi:serine/threonine protein kinase